MRVALFSNTYKPIINGIVASMEALRTFLESEGHEVFVFAPYFPGYRDSTEFVRRFPAVMLPTRTRFPWALPAARRHSREAANLDIDVFHSHHPFAMGIYAKSIAHRARRPLVTTIHTQYEQYLHYVPLPQAIVRPVVRRLVTRYCQACHWVTTPARGMADVIGAYGVRDRVSVVPNGVDLRRFRDASGKEVRQRYAMGPETILGLFTGRIAPEKNLPALLAMARLIGARHPLFRLVILGDGPDLPLLRRQAAEMGIADRVLFPGAVPHEQVAPYCAAADLFLTASMTEVNPTSVIEAMAAGTPVAAYDTFSMREIVQSGEDGLLTDHSPEALAAAVASLIGSENALARMAANAAIHAERFSLEVTGRQMLEVYARARAAMDASWDGR